jgi:hypothetical protein
MSDIRIGTNYLNVITEFISDIRTGTTYPNVAPEFIAHIRIMNLSYQNLKNVNCQKKYEFSQVSKIINRTKIGLEIKKL